MLFADLLSLHLVTFLTFFILVHVTFFSSRYMLELKLICHLLQWRRNHGGSGDWCPRKNYR